MTRTYFTCRLWSCDTHKLSTGKCYLDPERPQVKKASESCILWKEPGEIVME